ncbi:MAG: prolipoprotein diacylglyceryl transferase [Acidobacteriota bacterium]
MFPKLFVIPGFWGLPDFPIHFYGVFLALGYFTAFAFAARLGKRDGIDPDKIWDLSIWVLVSAVVGSKALLAVVDPEHAFSLRTAGVFYGGFVAATAVGMWYVRRHALPFWRVCDVAGPAIALGEGIGRIGCLSVGCCWGKETTSALGIVFTSQYAHSVVGVPLGVPLWPTQIILSINGFLLAAVLLFIARFRRFDGQVFWSFVLLHSVTRGMIEFLRGDPRGSLGPLSTSQVVAIGTALVAVAALVVLARRPRGGSPIVEDPGREPRRKSKRRR